MPDKYTHQLNEHDILVFASDGVWDNIFMEDIVACLRPDQPGSPELNLQHSADCISTKAEAVGYMNDYRSPFTVSAEKHGKTSLGGKPDDITVVVSQVKFMDRY